MLSESETKMSSKSDSRNYWFEAVQRQAAESIMQILLHNKLDKAGRPLADHCRRVAIKCRDEYDLSHEQILAAYLHDVIEEADENREGSSRIVIFELFGYDVLKIIDLLTRTVYYTYKDYIRRMSKYPHLIPIKLADLEDNLDPSRSTPEYPYSLPDSLRQRYEWARDYLKGQLDQINQG